MISDSKDLRVQSKQQRFNILVDEISGRRASESFWSSSATGGVVNIGSSVMISEMITCDSVRVCLFDGAKFAFSFLYRWDQSNLIPKVRDIPFVCILSSKEVPFQPHESSFEILENAFPRFRVAEFLWVHIRDSLGSRRLHKAPINSSFEQSSANIAAF